MAVRARVSGYLDKVLFTEGQVVKQGDVIAQIDPIAVLFTLAAALPAMMSRRQGVIINVSSVHQIIPKPDYLGYSVSKGGMQNLTRTLALEYAGHNIRGVITFA